MRTLTGTAATALLGVLIVSRFGAVYIGGRSMEPVMRPGDLAVFRRRVEVLSPGDVVVMSRLGSRRAVVHRVIEVGPDGHLSTRGDANVRADADRASPRDVSGVVIGVLPLGRAIAVVVGGAGWCYNRLPIANTRL